MLVNPTNAELEDQGETFTAYRKMVVKPLANQPELPGAIFQVRFRFKNLSVKTNQRLSCIPIPLIAAQSGFRSKTWLIGDDSGEFMGYYEFDTIEAAETYWSSLPLRMMRRRASPGSLTKRVTRLEPTER